MNLLLATLAAPLATAAVGAIPGSRRPKEAVFLGGLAAITCTAVLLRAAMHRAGIARQAPHRLTALGR